MPDGSAGRRRCRYDGGVHPDVPRTSVASRLVGFVGAAVFLLMTFGAGVLAVDAFDGGITIGGRRGRNHLGGWPAHVYGVGAVGLGSCFLSLATVCAAAALLPARVAARTLPLLKLTLGLFFATAAVLLVAVAGEVFD